MAGDHLGDSEVNIEKHSKPGWGLTQPSIPLWVGKMSTSKNIG